MATRSFPRRPLVEPISIVEHGFVGRAGFFVRVGALGVLATTLFAILFLRLWSLEVVQGSRFAQATRVQAFRSVHLPTARGLILDRSGRLLAGDSGQLAVSADAAALGTLDRHGRWRPTPTGRRQLRRLSLVTRVPTWRLIAHIRVASRRTPFAPAVIIPRPSRDLAFYLEERATSFRPFHVIVILQRWFPNGPLGSEFLGLLGEVNPQELGQRRHRGAQPGQIVGQSGVEATYERLLDAGRPRMFRSTPAAPSSGRCERCRCVARSARSS